MLIDDYDERYATLLVSWPYLRNHLGDAQKYAQTGLFLFITFVLRTTLEGFSFNKIFVTCLMSLTELNITCTTQLKLLV